MVDVVFSGSVSAQAVTGETVTLKVTKPDLTIDTWTTLTLADKTFTITKPYMVGGQFSVIAHVDADSQYKAADSASVAFTVLLARTITLNVTV